MNLSETVQLTFDRLNEDIREKDLLLKDCSMVIRVLCRDLPDDSKRKIAALDFLKRKGLQGSVLREEEEE